MRLLGVTLLLNFCDFVNSSTSLFRSSPNKNVDTAVDGLHKGAYCLFRSGRMRSLRFRLSSLFADNSWTAVWVKTFLWSPFALLHSWSTAYKPDKSKDCAFWKAESLFLVSCRNCCQICLFILGATKLVQFSGLRYLFCTSANFSFVSFSVSRLFTISAKFASMAGEVFSRTLNSSASDLKEPPSKPGLASAWSEVFGWIKSFNLVATAVATAVSEHSVLASLLSRPVS